MACGQFQPAGPRQYGMGVCDGPPDAQLLTALAREAERRAGDFNPQGLANTAWAFATLGQADLQLFMTLAREAEQRVSDFNPQDLANAAWAFATLGQADA